MGKASAFEERKAKKLEILRDFEPIKKWLAIESEQKANKEFDALIASNKLLKEALDERGRFIPNSPLIFKLVEEYGTKYHFDSEKLVELFNNGIEMRLAAENSNDSQEY